MKRSPWGKLSKSKAKQIKQVAKTGLVKGKAKVYKFK